MDDLGASQATGLGAPEGAEPPSRLGASPAIPCAERGDLRMIFAYAECVATPGMQRDLGNDIWAHIGPIGQFTSHPDLQDALGLVCLAFNRRHGRLSAEKHVELAYRDRGGAALLREAVEALTDAEEDPHP